MTRVLLRMLPLVRYAFFRLTGDLREAVLADVERWVPELQLSAGDAFHKFKRVFIRFPEFRSLLYYRLAQARLGFGAWMARRLLLYCHPGQVNLYIHAKSIGKGLRIQHGFSTIIAAHAIGDHCLVNQQVTIGYSNSTDCPTIGNHVQIRAGAKVIGGVVIGDHVKIGANAVVVKDVPPNCTVVGVPAGIVKRNGIRTEEAL